MRAGADDCLMRVKTSVAVNWVVLGGGDEELVGTFVRLQGSHHGQVVRQL